jgi:hypothetical protein
MNWQVLVRQKWGEVAGSNYGNVNLIAEFSNLISSDVDNDFLNLKEYGTRLFKLANQVNDPDVLELEMPPDTSEKKQKEKPVKPPPPTVEQLLERLKESQSSCSIPTNKSPYCSLKSLVEMKKFLMEQKKEYDGSRRIGLFADYKFGWYIKYARKIYQKVRNRKANKRPYEFYDWLKSICGIAYGRSWISKIIAVAELCEDYPGFLKCATDVSTLYKYRKKLTEYLKENSDIANQWV